MSIKYKVLQDKKWLEKEIAIKSFRLIAKEVGCSYGAVMYTVTKFGLKIPLDVVREKRPTENLSEKSKKGLALKYPEGRFGRLASNWKGGRKRTKSGYIYIYKPEHKYATNDGYVMEHRLVIEQKTGRMVLPHEDVNHINGIKDDNRPENLEVLTRKQHSRKHFDDAKEVDRLKKLLDENGIVY